MTVYVNIATYKILSRCFPTVFENPPGRDLRHEVLGLLGRQLLPPVDLRGSLEIRVWFLLRI